MKSELKKVTWPNQKTVVKNTGTVLLCSPAHRRGIWIFDGVAVTAFDPGILSLFGVKECRNVGKREVVCDPYLFRL